MALAEVYDEAGPGLAAGQAEFAPFWYRPLEKDAPFFRALYYLNRNPLELLTAELYQRPVSEKTFLGRRAIFINDARLTKYFFADRSDVYTIDPIRRLLLRPGFGLGLASIDGPAWVDNRSVTRRYFRAERLEGYARVFLDSAVEACRSLEPGRVIDLQRFVSTISLRSSLVGLFSTTAEGPVEDGVGAFNDVMKYHMTVDAADVLLLPTVIPRVWKRRAARPLRTCRRLARTIVEARLAARRDGRSADDLLDGYLREWIRGARPTRREKKRILDNVGTMLGASFETTSLTLTWTLYFLLNCPRFLGEIEDELRRSPHRDLGPADWPKVLPNTTAALMETLRVYPILPAIVRYATEEDAIPGADVRPGDFIVANLWTQHRDERHWADATAYRPERFLDRAASRTGGYFPFGVGPRGCVGAQYAILEGVIVLARILERFRFTLVTPDVVKPEWRGTLRPHRPIPVRVDRR